MTVFDTRGFGVITPALYEIKILAGDAFDLSLNWKDDDGILFNLTTWKARMRLFTSERDRTVLKTLH